MPLGGVLYVVATPIGNLEDITLRALKMLKTVQLVAAEDTRRTGNLLRHFDIDIPILSVHEHNEDARVQKIVGRLAKGESIALVTDAGTPGFRILAPRWWPQSGRRGSASSRSPAPAPSLRPFRRRASKATASPSWNSHQLGLKTANYGSRRWLKPPRTVRWSSSRLHISFRGRWRNSVYWLKDQYLLAES